jgi:cell division protein FtsB
MDIKTNVVIQAETRGFDKALRETLGLTQGALQGLKDQASVYTTVQKQVTLLQGKIAELAKQQMVLNQEITKLERGTEAYDSLKESIKATNEEMQSTERQVQLTTRAFRSEADAAKKLAEALQGVNDKQTSQKGGARGSFTQGLLQGVAPGGAGFLQRGPGMKQQFLGQMIGHGAKEGLGGLLSSPVQGLGGISRAMSVLPGGGLVAGMMENAMKHADTGMAWREQQFAAAPFMGGGALGNIGPMQDINADYDRQKADLRFGGADAIKANYTKEFNRQMPMAKMNYDAEKHAWDPENAPDISQLAGKGPGFRRANAELKKKAEYQWGSVKEDYLKQFDKSAALAIEDRSRLLDLKRKEELAPIHAAREAPFEGARRAGYNLMGKTRQQSTEEALGLVQAGGGTVQGALQSGMLPTAFAAKTAFGVGSETSGAFLAAGRRGGLVGGAGKGAEGLSRSLSDAVKLGLTGSDAIKYLQTIASGIAAWEQSGIEFNKDSFRNMADSLNSGGIAMSRAMNIASGFQNYTQGMGQRGISGGRDLMLLQMMGGFKGGGADDLEQATLQLESMQQQGGVNAVEAGGPMGDFMQRMMEMGGGGASGRRFLRGQLGQMGIQTSGLEINAMAERLTGEQLLTPEQRDQMAADKKRREAGAQLGADIATPGGLQKLAAGMVPGVVKNQAQVQEEQLAVGLKMIPAMQTLARTSATMAEAFSNLAGGEQGALNKFLKVIEGATVALDEFTKNVEKYGVAKALGMLGAN